MVGDPDRDDDPIPEFARETRVVDFGQDAPALEMMAAGGDPIPVDLKVVFRTIKGPECEQVAEMNKPIVILGRVEGVADVIVHDEAASRYHACVSHRDGKFILSDMGSTNGTFVNRQRVGEVNLAHQDQIRIGVTVLSFEIWPRD